MGLINEDKLDDYVFKSASERMDLSVEYMSGWNDAINHIKANAPTVDAEPVRLGEWIYGVNSDGFDGYRCSCCMTHFAVDDVSDYHYCPYCGAKMDGVEE